MSSTIPADPVSILMPVCNEADIIEEVLQEWIEDVLQKLPEGSELVLDDASNDGTEKIIADLAEKYPFVRVNHHGEKDGYFRSVYRLYRAAKCPLIFITDSDGQYLPSEFWMLAEYCGDYDVVHGAKTVREDPFYRAPCSAIFTVFSRYLFHHPYHDVNSVHRFMKRHVVEKLLPKTRHMPILINTELLMRCHAEGFTIKEVPISHRPRKHGVSRGLPMHKFLVDGWRACRGLLRIRREYRH
jgi:glycosyltransferase involved in cell wall biosynthesis